MSQLKELNSTPASTVDAAQLSIYASMTPAQKWQEVRRLRNAAWDMKRAFLRAQNPAWSDETIELAVAKIFLYAST